MEESADLSRQNAIFNVFCDEEWKSVVVKRKNMIFDEGDKIRYKINEVDDVYVEAIIKSRSGKASGEFKNRFNVVGEDKEYRVDFDKVFTVEKAVKADVALHFIEDSIWVVMVPKSRFSEPEIVEAMKLELDTLKSFNTYEEVKDNGQECISMRWIITEKPAKAGRKMYKARLVCRGFEEEDGQYQIDSPTVDKASVRLFLSIASTMKWFINSVDIKAAFLQSETFDRTVFVRPPKSVKRQGVIWSLLKPLYGLSDSCRNWYFTLKKALNELGLTISQYDKAMFYFRDENKLQGIVIIHVDDLLYAGSGKFQNIMKEVSQRFKISKCEQGAFRYIGLDLKSDLEMLRLSQKSYCSVIKAVKVSNARKAEKEELLDKVELKEYQSLLGKLNWLSCNSRPDLKFEVFWHSLFKKPLIKNLLTLNKVVGQVGKGPECIAFPKLELTQLRLICYSDASLGNLDEGVKSCKAYILFLADDSKCAALSWNCKNIDRVCDNTLEAEARALKFGITYAIATSFTLKELLQFDVPIYCIIDSKTLLDACYSTKNVGNPVLRRDIALLQQKLNKGEIQSIERVKSISQLADVLTKRGVNPVKLAEVLETGTLPAMEAANAS